MEPKYLQEKRSRVTCSHCLTQSGARAGIRRYPAKADPPLEVWAVKMFRRFRGPSQSSTPAGWMRLFKKEEDAEKFVVKACRAIVGHNIDVTKKWVSWAGTKVGHRHLQLDDETRFDLLKYRVM